LVLLHTFLDQAAADLQCGQSIIEILKSIEDELCRYINFYVLIPYLIMLTKDELQIFSNSQYSEKEKIGTLLRYLSHKNEEDQRKFLKAVYDASDYVGHKEICKILRERGLNISSEW